jgi:3-isopropylmalate dehydratase small subunit
VLPADDVRALGQAGEGRVDLDAQVVAFAGREVAFEIDADIRHRLLNGLDDIGATLQRVDAIDRYERERERPGPVTTAL